jgi:Subtilase family
MAIAGKLYAYQKTHEPVQQEVVLAECDGPVRDHPDWSGRWYPPVNETGEAYDADDPSELDHGAHSASPALAGTDNGTGVISVGGLTFGVKGQSIKIFDSTGRLVSAGFQKCLQDVLAKRAAGINIRVIHGGWSVSQPDISGTTDQLLNQLGDQGVLVAWGVFEEGKNLDTNPEWPMAYAKNHWNVILVQATHADGTLLPNESTSQFVKFKAYGENIQVVSYFDGFNSMSYSGGTPASALVAAAILEIELYRQPDAKLAAVTTPPVIATDPLNPTVAAALEVGTDKVGPFKLDGEFPFSADKTDKVSRIALNVAHLDFLAGEDLSAVKVNATDSIGQTISLPVEAVGYLSATDRRYAQVQVRLAIKPTVDMPNPPKLATGTVTLTVTHNGFTSAPVMIQVVN